MFGIHTSRDGFIELPPTSFDRAVSKHAIKFATRTNEHALRIATWLADERVMCAAAGLLWLTTHLHGSSRRKAESDRLILNVAIAGALPHLIKRIVNRERPNRSVAHVFPRHGIPRSGKKWDSFPSGHALHLGAA